VFSVRSWNGYLGGYLDSLRASKGQPSLVGSSNAADGLIMHTCRICNDHDIGSVMTASFNTCLKLQKSANLLKGKRSEFVDSKCIRCLVVLSFFKSLDMLRKYFSYHQ
jgi:hypothetical protein